ncbi:alpha-galactosidase [Bacillus sp. SJS]|nr:alpha-galactosidase [Bacillus sp. SJS]KZZ84344.1 alpha-galactosidase [Bacillus sp. SJS]
MIYSSENPIQFHLQNENISYVIQVLKNGHIGHLYFGKRLTDSSHFHRMQPMAARAAMSCVYEGDLSFSLDGMKLDYPVYGTSDYREPALHILQNDGSRITDFSYASHRILNGKPFLEGLPATYTETEGEAETLEITLTDDLIQTKLVLSYTIFRDSPAIARSAKIFNEGKESICIERMASASIDFSDSDYEFLHLSGSWSRERHIKSRVLESGIQSISSTRGTSSSQHNPFFALKRPNTTETDGAVYGISLIYSGNFLGQIEVDHYDIARATIGINPFDFSWTLESGESFQTPEAVFIYSDQGLNKMSQEYHKLYQSRLARGVWRDRERPVLINNWEATYFNFDEKKLQVIAREAKELGIEMFVLDDGWFGKRDNDTSSLGDWTEDRSKLPNGLKNLSENITKLGMKFGIWFEPEMISKASDLYNLHPEWLIQVKGRSKSHGRNQYVLDFSRQEVVDHIYSAMADVLSTSDISYVKWDMNRYMTEVGSLALPAHKQKEVPHRYILGVYSLYEKLIKAFPHVLFESCASGGARFDPGMLYYAPQAWTSDDTDAVERLKIQYGTSILYPLSSMGSHVSAVPNHQVKRSTPLKTRGDVAFFGTFGYELDVMKLNDEEKKEVISQVSFYKEHRRLIQFGTFYRLKSPFAENSNETSWMTVAPDKSKAILAYYQTLARPNDRFRRIYLQGLKPNACYTITQIDTKAHETLKQEPLSYYGDELMYAGFELGAGYTGTQFGGIDESGDFTSKTWLLTEV